ncbi:MAG TPA: indolepyruvate oxidoreductase subunit beta family protein [Casimicrobiaceae bacterium]|nr:indolepyruvate oxidoreductase subunit beta family protein [Casimicrobiaceae bacterium]
MSADINPELSSAARTATPVSVLIGALGGQGGGVLAEWLVEAATRAGYVAQGTSIPGVAQRTGGTTYYVEVFSTPRAALGGRLPVLGLYPIPGRVDLAIASELLEAGRMLQAGYVSADRTRLIASTSRTLTTVEKMAQGDGRVSSQRLLDAARATSRQLDAFDMDAMARDAGTVVSSVMLGAIAGSGVLPIAREMFEETIRAGRVGVDASLRGFAQGYAAVAGSGENARVHGANDSHTPDTDFVAATGAQDSYTSDTNLVADPRLAAFPSAARETIALGHARVVEFQDARYGDVYLERLARIDAAERRSDAAGAHDARALRETARFLALWMAFDDVIRVAALKCRASRFARVRREIRAGPDDVVRIVDHFKPGVSEIAGMLPAAWARRLVAFDRKRQARGREPLAWPLHLRAHSIHGFVLLRMLASLRVMRRRGMRYHEEQRAIEQWLQAIEAGCTTDATLGYEIALCGRLVKGYGATNARGKATLAHIVQHVAGAVEQGAAARAAAAQPVAARAAAVRSAREAALADEAGKAFDAELARQGKPARPVVVQPIRFAPPRTRAAPERKPTATGVARRDTHPDPRAN